MDSRGQIINVGMELFVGAIMIVIGIFVFNAMWDPIYNLVLAPQLSNSQAFTYGAISQTILALTPLVIVILGFMMIISGFQRARQPPAVYPPQY